MYFQRKTADFNIFDRISAPYKLSYYALVIRDPLKRNKTSSYKSKSQWSVTSVDKKIGKISRKALINFTSYFAMHKIEIVCHYSFDLIFETTLHIRLNQY